MESAEQEGYNSIRAEAIGTEMDAVSLLVSDLDRRLPALADEATVALHPSAGSPKSMSNSSVGC